MTMMMMVMIMVMVMHHNGHGDMAPLVPVCVRCGPLAVGVPRGVAETWGVHVDDMLIHSCCFVVRSWV